MTGRCCWFLVAVIFVCVLVGSAPVGAADFYVLGVPELGWVAGCRWELFAIGAVSSLLVHEFGHYLALETTGTRSDWSYFPECTYWPGSDGDGRVVAASGFMLQHAVGTALTSLGRYRESDFTRGYTLSSFLVTASYPFRNNGSGDFHSFDRHGGNAGLLYGVACVFALHNLLRIEW